MYTSLGHQRQAKIIRSKISVKLIMLFHHGSLIPCRLIVSFYLLGSSTYTSLGRTRGKEAQNCIAADISTQSLL